MDYDNRPGAGAYLVIFIVILLAMTFFVLALGWLGAKNSPSLISANANATAISRDSLGALMVSAAQSYGFGTLAIGSVVILLTGISMPLAITAMTVSYLQSKRPNTNILIVAESRSQIREVLPYVLEAGADLNRTQMHVMRREQVRPHPRKFG